MVMRANTSWVGGAIFMICGCASGPPRTSAPPANNAVAEPSFDRIDYRRPELYLTVGKSFGSPELIQKSAAEIGRGKKSEETLTGIGAWIDTHLRSNPDDAYVYRTFDQMLAAGTYGGCADHALIFAALSRTLGIPTVFVKTMDVDWIREFKRAPQEITSWRGHVFLEVYMEGRWKLLDASQMVLYDDYHPKARLLPGARYAYDKGIDPYDVVLSTRWEIWKEQTAKYFGALDTSVLPLGGGRTIATRNVHVVANRPVWQWVHERLGKLGVGRVFSFNTDFDEYLPRAKGQWLIVTVVGTTNVLPAKYQATYYPASAEEIARLLTQRSSGRLDRRLQDGTRVTLLYAKDEESMRAEVARLEPADTR